MARISTTSSSSSCPSFRPIHTTARARGTKARHLRDWITPRVLELTYTAWDLEPFARDLGYDGPPFRWDPERRFLLRCELDAAFFHLYGIERDDVDYIMETFPIVKRKDEAAHGEYRTKRVILEIYDQMARAAETGQPYQTPLDPPPAELDLAAERTRTRHRQRPCVRVPTDRSLQLSIGWQRRGPPTKPALNPPWRRARRASQRCCRTRAGRGSSL